MERIVIVAYDGVQSLDVSGPAEVFACVGRLDGAETPAPYAITVAAVGGGPIRSTSGCTLVARDLTRMRPRRTDTVLVAGGSDSGVRRAVRDEALVGWVTRASRVVRRIGSVCSGAFVLAQAGLLDGRRATTHWSSCDLLARFRPQIRVDPNAIFVQDGHVWTSAGVTTGIDMALAMVEGDQGRATADRVAARLVLYLRRPGSQAQFSEALVTQTTSSDPLGATLAWARQRLADVDVDGLARHACLSRRTFHRRCLDHLGATPAKLLEKLRVEHARALLSTSTVPAKALAAQCGFGTTARMKRALERALGAR